MSSAESARRRGPDILLTVAVYAAIVSALLPLFRVVSVGPWTAGAVFLPAVLLAAGFLARQYRLPAIAVTLLEVALWTLSTTVLFLRDTAFLGIVPLGGSIPQAVAYVQQAGDEIVQGAAPLEAGSALSFMLVAAIGLLTIVIDHVVLTARMPLLAAVGLIPISLIPAIAVPADVDVGAFVLLSASILLMIRAETRRREGSASDLDAAGLSGGRTGAIRARSGGEITTRPVGLAATATGIGAVAVVVALVVTPLLPAPVARTAGFGPGGNSIDPTLQLGEDLRRPRDVEVLTMYTDAANAPYLRAATLTTFDGEIWRPDSGRSVTLDSGDALGPVVVDDDVRVKEFTAEIQVRDLVSPWLPVAYPAISVTGLQGDWAAMPSNRTVLSSATTASGQNYEVITHEPRPTLEQIQASTAVDDNPTRNPALALPTDLPRSIAEQALAITEGAATDYDKLRALQTWFRGPDFEYSLDAPVEDGFDGTGVEAIDEFLRVRSGYCVHFASAFALMARTLDMPTRIVVGYLPGVATGDQVDGEPVYSVTSAQLHAWPEVYFQDFGWIAFEPTKSRGTPTSFSPAASATPVEGGQEVEPTPRPTTSAAPQGPDLPDEEPTGEAGGATGATGGLSALPWAGLGLGIIVLLALPALVQVVRRRTLVASAREGDAAAAWRLVQDAAIDLGIPLPRGESPRAFGQRLVTDAGAPADEIALLVAAIERASYARGTGRQFGDGPAMADAATQVRSAMVAQSDVPRRIMAVAAPRSLVISPGSVFAGDAVHVR